MHPFRRRLSKMSPSLTTMILQLGILSFLTFRRTTAAFGDVFDYGRDDTFDIMGDAKIAEFTVTNSEHGFCKDGWQQYEAVCYKAFDTVSVNYEDALQSCTDDYDGILAVISNENINDFLTEYMTILDNPRYQIGLKYDSDSSTWIWADDTVIGDYQPWDPNVATLGCAELSSSGKWLRGDCNAKLGYICQREAVPGQAHLYITYEDTFEEDEIWIFDFQPYEFGGLTPIVTTGVGSVIASNTGTCSNAFADAVFSDSTTGFYKDPFQPNPPGEKELFQTYTRGTYISEGDLGDGISFRRDLLTFDGEMESLFECEDSRGNNVWEQNVMTDSIEFNTTLYMTNIRPRHSTDGTLEPSYVQSYVVLYWRLLRLAISRFLISSVERLIPIFEYATVTAVYLNNDDEYGIDRARAEVEVSFWTVTALHPADTMISVYKPASLKYTPANVLNSLEYVKDVPDLGCEDYLGMESGRIADSRISVSSSTSEPLDAKFGRLNMQKEDGVTGGAWFAGPIDTTPWIAVTFEALITITGVITQGQMTEEIAYWVTSYYVQYLDYASETLMYVNDEEGNPKNFSANFDWNTPVVNHFLVPIRTKQIRIEPIRTNNGFADNGGQVVLRFELLGCRDALPVRLVDGGPSQGRVEVMSGYDEDAGTGTWGTICGNSWSTNAATVVCRQLGYRYAEKYDDSLVSPGSGAIGLDGVICNGREATLDVCTSSAVDPGCIHTQDVVVVCSTDPIPDEPSVRLVDGTHHYEGRVEIWYNNEWGSVCHDGWGIEEAHVVCRELGFADAKEAVLTTRFGEADEDMRIWLDEVTCDGDETNLGACTHAAWGSNDCGHSDDAGVVCMTDSPHQSVEDMAVLHAPPCNYTFWPGGCTQHWQFMVVLEVDTSTAVQRMPIDATGEFEFKYYLYECPDITAENAPSRDTCNRIDVPDAIISHQITLQTTVEVTDADRDSPMIEVVRIYAGDDDSRDLRYNLFKPGVSHLETVTLETRFYPEFLRQTLEMELTLFMVCIGEEYQSMRDGCLAAPADQRFSAFTHPEFQYVMEDTSELTADNIADSSQELETYEYILDQDIHKSTFINKALSAESRIYTITNVFQLVERNTGRRQTRDVGVVRRDIMDNAQASLGSHHALFFAGCPEHSTYNGARDCACDDGYTYSTETYRCEQDKTDAEETNELPADEVASDDEELDNVIDIFLKDEDDYNNGGTSVRWGMSCLLMAAVNLVAVLWV